MINEPRGALTCLISTLTVLSILTCFVEYYSPFWGPKAISIIVEPQGALKCRSSTIAVWADSGPFLGLLLSFGGPGVISMIYEPSCAFMCRSSTLAVLSILTRLVDYYSPFWGSQSDLHGCRTPRCAYVLVVKTCSFGRFSPVSWSITQFLWSRSDFHD